MKIAFELWSTGLINQLMSLELAVGISEFYNTEVLLYNIKKEGIYSPIAYDDNARKGIVEQRSESSVPKITDLVDWNNDFWVLESENIKESLPNYETIVLTDHYIDCGGDPDELHWKYDKQFIADPDKSYNFEVSICYYSQFFKNRTKQIDKALSNIKWKKPYFELAMNIAKELGEFSGAHLRMTDHRNVVFAVSEQSFLDELAWLESKGLPVIICTDNPQYPWIKSNSNRYKFIDDIILENWKESFTNLPFRDEVTFSLICNLVMGYSKYFVGTVSSTYTGYIQRMVDYRTEGFEWRFFDGEYGTDFEKFPKDYEPKPRWWREIPNHRLIK